MTEYYKDELLNLVDGWSIESLDNYIQKLELRVELTKDQIRALKVLKRRKNRNNNLKDNGTRGGK